MGYYLGVDIGSVNAKLALVDENGGVVEFDTAKVISSPRAAVSSLIARLGERFDLKEVVAAGVSGSGRAVIPKELGWTEYSSSLAIASGLLHHYPDVKTVIQIGGQSTLVIELEDGLKKPWKVESNPLCAAGTGRFLEQQAYRIGISMEDFASLALKFKGTAPRIAARCSVFAKTDLIHLQQKGAPLDAMLYALCESVARMVSSLKKGTFQEPAYFVGGVAANPAVAKSLNEMISARNGHPVEVIIPEDYLHMESLGSALLSIGKTSQGVMLSGTDAEQRHFEMPRLEIVAPTSRSKDSQRIEEQCVGYVGVDVGSTSTKAVIMDESGTRLLGKNYLMTAGRPVEAVRQVFRNLLRDGADKVKIAGVGVTGSGRYLVGGFIGADLIKNEITAQTRAGAEIDPEADIIEIGGQDSKLVIKRKGVVVDYHMNKACAAGTGSFIDELAEMLGVSVTNGQFADLAFAASHTIELGTRCAAFMGQAVASAQQEGVPLEIITASLANSIAKNYLSKVVEHRKLGNKVILTGAVFYNKAVVSAFHQQLKGKKLTVPEHKEVSGAIGVALLAKEAMALTKSEKPVLSAVEGSKFKGFQEVVDRECKLTTFVCKGCDNNCTITRMEMPGEEPSFYGSRCDKYDAIASHAKKETFFDKREQLLFREYKKDSGTGPKVGIPRALLVYDYAPLLIGFLNALDARVVLSSQTNNAIMEQATELSYTDSCFPMKLLHGHAAMLKDADYILYPCAIRLGRKDGDASQKYSCPLVQASPFIIRNVLGFGERLLIPIIDFSRGDDDVIKNLADVAVKMGFSRKKGQEAARAGIESQRRFEADRAVLGRELLRQLRQSPDSSRLGVVLFARSYMSQDAGANLGIAEKLAQLGVVPIPLDFLPLESVNAKDYSDRPYWYYENKYIAGADITVSDPQLYGLWLTNFGCGPNSFIIHLVEDIMGGKPLGQLEIDEHAAEAGIVTRLEAFVDTIQGFAHSAGKQEAPDKEDIYRKAFPPVIDTTKTFIIPRMTPHVELVSAVLEGSGFRAVVLPEANERNLFYADKVTSGVECLPYRVTLGDFLRFCYEDGTDLKNVEAVMASAYGPCRFGKYALEQIKVLKEVGFDLPIRTTVSNNAYRDTEVSPRFARLAWKGCVAIDYLQRLLWRTRPYEKRLGSADELFDEYLGKIVGRVRNKESFDDILRQSTSDFRSFIDPELPRRPLVGINGEIFLRSNRFSNQDLVRECEKAGLEVVVSSIGEWLKYIFYRHVEDAVRDRKFLKALISYIIKRVWEHDEHTVVKRFQDLVDVREPSTEEVLAWTSHWLSPKCGSEAVLSIGSGVEWMENPEFAGVISVMPHGCMPGGIVAAMSDKFSALYRKPWINLTYDGFVESTNLTRINNFAEVLRFCSQERNKDT
jgi:predicted CoA-substrate-specific enzyme activase